MLKSSIFTILFFILTTAMCYGEVDYHNFNSIEDVIEFETSCISDIPFHSYEDLSDAYASRGESYLLCGRFGNALEDFQEAYNLALNVQDFDAANTLIFRSLFDQAITYGYLDMPEKVDIIMDLLLDVIHNLPCTSAQNEDQQYESHHSKLISYSPFRKCKEENTPLLGPDNISVRDCIDLVDNARDVCLLLVSFAPLKFHSTLSYTITKLAGEARRCCLAGGLWKGCFQKLGNKFHQWNEKWQVFRIPPDPAWD